MATPPVLLEAAMSGPDRLFTEPRPVKLAQACNLTAMVDDGASFWGALGLLVAGVGATQLLTEPAQSWFHLRGRQTS
ncbi:hypothetical protein AB0G05_06555 [Nonomuraea wenchangensis]